MEINFGTDVVCSKRMAMSIMALPDSRQLELLTLGITSTMIRVGFETACVLTKLRRALTEVHVVKLHAGQGRDETALQCHDLNLILCAAAHDLARTDWAHVEVAFNKLPQELPTETTRLLNLLVASKVHGDVIVGTAAENMKLVKQHGQSYDLIVVR